MLELFDGKVVVIENKDGNKEELGDNHFVLVAPDKVFKDVLKASYVLYFDEDTNELTVLKARKDVKLQHGIRK